MFLLQVVAKLLTISIICKFHPSGQSLGVPLHVYIFLFGHYFHYNLQYHEIARKDVHFRNSYATCKKGFLQSPLFLRV